MIDFTQKPEYLDWIGKQLDCDYSQGQFTTMANLSKSGEVLCVVIYYNWLEHGCEMSIASSSPRWATKDFMHAAFAYPFIQGAKRRITFIVEDNNLKSLKMCLRIGAKVEGKARNWYGKNNGIIFGLLRNECKYLRETDHSAIPQKEFANG